MSIGVWYRFCLFKLHRLNSKIFGVNAVFIKAFDMIVDTIHHGRVIFCKRRRSPELKGHEDRDEIKHGIRNRVDPADGDASTVTSASQRWIILLSLRKYIR